MISINIVQAFNIFMTKSYSSLVIEDNFLPLIKDIYRKPTTTILNCERLNIFSLKSVARRRCPIFTTSTEHFTRVLDSLVRQDKEIKTSGMKEISKTVC